MPIGENTRINECSNTVGTTDGQSFKDSYLRGGHLARADVGKVRQLSRRVSSLFLASIPRQQRKQFLIFLIEK